MHKSRQVNISCDGSPTGLISGVLLKSGCPVAYASKFLTEAEFRYAQIEKITFSCSA